MRMFTGLTLFFFVLLGLRTAYKDALQASAADLVYGEPLRIPGELLMSEPVDIDPSTFIQLLRSRINKLRPTPASRNTNPGSFIHNDLSTCTHVFLRLDGTRRSLQPPYSGPHLVISRNDKTFNITVRDKTTTVSADRVKPAFFVKDVSPNVPSSSLQNTPPTYIQPFPTSLPPKSQDLPSTTPNQKNTRTTRSGRTVHFPSRFLT